MNKIEWRDGTVDKNGIYAVHYSWDAREGSFCGVCEYVNGWKENLPIGNFAGPFDTKENAEQWIEINDISF
jgi:hypothetical protein